MKLFRSFYLARRLFIVLGTIVFLFVLGYFYPVFTTIGRVSLLTTGILLTFDFLLLYRTKEGIKAVRESRDKLSNGDENEIRLHLECYYPFTVQLEIIDEIPFQFQLRDFSMNLTLPANSRKIITYSLRPVERGEYSFGAINIFTSSPIGFIQRRYQHDQNRMLPVYPSYLQMRKYELLAHSNRLSEAGIKKMRRIGHTMEFDQIRDYVVGDDYRTLNWKATARTARFMVNQYQDEKSQRVYSIIDKGRTMKSPFEGMTLLDYAINASLVLSNIAIYKQDKAGLITFSNTMGTLIPADRRRTQMHHILEALYNQKTEFRDASYELLSATILRKLTTRSLLFLYTNFETLYSLERQLPYLRHIAQRHLLVVVFFENTTLRDILNSSPTTTEEIYRKTVAEKFSYEKRQIVKELERHGIIAVLTTPAGLTVDSINKYLELKARRMI